MPYMLFLSTVIPCECYLPILFVEYRDLPEKFSLKLTIPSFSLRFYRLQYCYIFLRRATDGDTYMCEYSG